MKVSYLVAALILLIIVLSISFYFSIQQEEPVEERIAIEEIREEPIEVIAATKATEKIEAAIPTEGGTEAPSEAVVEIKDGVFNPAGITIKQGTTVTWVNKDTRAHKVAAYSRYFYGGFIKPGENYSYTFDEVGVYKYFDVIFSKTMRNGIVRVESRYFPVTGGAVASSNRPETAGLLTILAIIIVLAFFLEIRKKSE